MNRRLSIKRRLVIYVGSIVILGLVINGLIAGILCERLIKDKEKENLQVLVAQYEDKVNMLIEQRAIQVKLLREKAILTDRVSDLPLQLKQLKHKLERDPEYINFKDIVLVGGKGDHYSMNGIVYDFNDLEGCREVLKSQSLLVELTEIKGEKVLAMILPLEKENGHNYVLMAIEPIQHFMKVLKNVGIKEELFILDPNAQLIVGKQRDVMAAEGIEGSQCEASIYQKVAHNPKKVLECHNTNTGESNLIIHASTDLGWTIGIVHPNEIITQPIQLLWAVLGLSAFGIIGAVLTGVYLISKSLSIKINNIACCIDTVANGDFEQPIPENLLEMKDEMGDVARALNNARIEIEDMLGTIKGYTDYMNDQMESLDQGYNHCNPSITSTESEI